MSNDDSLIHPRLDFEIVVESCRFTRDIRMDMMDIGFVLFLKLNKIFYKDLCLVMY